LNSAAAATTETSEEEEKKFETFKNAGNEFFKSKWYYFGTLKCLDLILIFIFLKQTKSSQMPVSNTRRPFSLKSLTRGRLSCTATVHSPVLKTKKTSLRSLMRAKP